MGRYPHGDGMISGQDKGAEIDGLSKIENKGKRNRRFYLVIDD